ncbi:MAG: SDR family NAD(P)-dependent oxidoreductase [Proteobacteria bacterium]|nr:SDR family NAD(P)-dependent oxidoreductase [Pseudomonadota bacterium]
MALMDGKCCIVTGGAGSLGLASAKVLLAEGAKVMLVDLSQDDLDKAAAELNSSDVLTAAADVTKAADTQAYINQAVEAWGRLDVLFSNAGHSGTNAPITDYPEDIFDNVIDVNIKGSFLALKYAIPHMTSGGSIIVTSSIMGVQARPNSVGYITSKHALVGMVRCVAREVAAKNIRVNILAPGPITNEFQTTIEDRMSKTMGIDATAMLNNTVIPLGRHGLPEEIAQSVLFLASDQSSFSTGSVFMADGGWNA